MESIATTLWFTPLNPRHFKLLQGVIIAQVAITSLSLPQIRQTHWAVRAFFITSLISGCFAVYFACWSQKTIGTLFKASDLKNWLTRRDSVPLSGWAIRANLRALAELKKLADRIKTGTIVEGIGDIEKGQFHELVRLQNESIRCHEWQRSASLWSAFLLQVPFTYMKLSLGSFVIGLTIYLGSVWTRNLDQEAGKNDSRNIFIVLLIVVVACIYFYVAPALYKSLEVLPIRSWMDCQEQLKEVAESLGRFVPKDKQHSLQSDPGSKASGKRKNAPEIPAAGTDEISILTNPAPKNPLDEMPVASSAGDTDIAQLSAALKAATSAQMSNNLAIQNLVTEIANLTGAMRDQERHPSLSRNPA